LMTWHSATATNFWIF